MRRAWLAAFGGIAVLSLSCGIRSTDPVPFETPSAQTRALAPALAGPPAPPVEAPATAQPGAERTRIDALVAFIAAQSQGRLIGSELRDVAVAIRREVERQHLDLRLILALIHVESRYDPFAVSPVGAMGLMQLLPATGEELAHKLGIEWHGPETLFDPVVNVRLGITYVKQLTNRYDEVSTALAAYNWGMGTIDKRLRRGSPVPRVYPGLVMEAYDRAVLPVRS